MIGDDGQDRRLAILDRLLDHGEGFTTGRLCQVCANVTGVTGAGIMPTPSAATGPSPTWRDVVDRRLRFDAGSGETAQTP